MKPREPFFKPEDGDMVLMVSRSGEVWQEGKAALSIEEANRLVEPLLQERELLVYQVTKDTEENERLRVELEVQKILQKAASLELAALKAEIDQAPIIGYRTGYMSGWESMNKQTNYSHTARLVRIEEIKK